MNAKVCDRTYIGDGLYASFDGFGIWIASSNGHADMDRVYLEPEVYAALVRYVERLNEKSEEPPT